MRSGGGVWEYVPVVIPLVVERRWGFVAVERIQSWSFERVVMGLVRAEETLSAARAAADVILVISSSAVVVSDCGLARVDLRLREVARRVERCGGESRVGFEEADVEVGVVGARRVVDVFVLV